LKLELGEAGIGMKCPLCGDPLVLVLPTSPYLEAEVCCLTCGYVQDELASQLGQSRLEDLVDDLSVLRDDIALLGAKPLDRSELIRLLTRYCYVELFSRQHKLVVKEIPPSEKELDSIEAMLRMKFTRCLECGKIIEYTTRRPRLCASCTQKYRRAKAREGMRRLRERRSSVNSIS